MRWLFDCDKAKIVLIKKLFWTHDNLIFFDAQIDDFLFQLGTTLDQMTLNMVEVASQTISATEVDYGDSFTFEAEIDIPGILALNKSDLNVELFALNPD